jgi:hypothetical protein
MPCLSAGGSLPCIEVYPVWGSILIRPVLSLDPDLVLNLT